MSLLSSPCSSRTYRTPDSATLDSRARKCYKPAFVIAHTRERKGKEVYLSIACWLQTGEGKKSRGGKKSPYKQKEKAQSEEA
jgi:hypothetical protein